MSRNLDSHQFSNVSIIQGDDGSMIDGGVLDFSRSGVAIPNGVMKDSGLNSRSRLNFRVRSVPWLTPDAGERILKRTGGLVLVLSVEQFDGATLTNYDVSRTNSMHAIVLGTIANNNYFNATPMKIGVLHYTDPTTPVALYPSGVTNIYNFVTVTEAGASVDSTEIIDMIDDLATSVGTVTMVVADDPDGLVLAHVQANYGLGVFLPGDAKLTGFPFRTQINTRAVPDLGASTMDQRLRVAYESILRYHGPLLVSVSSVASPTPAYDIGAGYRFDRDTEASG